jgi:lysyl-tRNA synthetase class 2
MSDEQLSSTEEQLIEQRRAKLGALREAGQAFPNDFRRNALAGDLQTQYLNVSGEDLDATKPVVLLAGRLMTRRIMGKASFVNLKDMSGTIQIYVKRDELGEETYDAFKHWDLGDILGVEGYVFRTRTGELSVHATQIRLLTKSLRPLPEKWHGLTDLESRYRQRYVDLIVNDEARRVFQVRSRAIEFIRRFLNERQFLEVETPMMQAIPGGATARPFITHHNALDMELYLRIAPELYLKRLVVGGMERVFEINRNFRNEGLSPRHNPEFTMLEFYAAYEDYHYLMDLTEELFRGLALHVLGTTTVSYQGHEIDFSQPFRRLSVRESILEFNPGVTAEEIADLPRARALAALLRVPVEDSAGLGRVLIDIFDKTVEHKLLAPTFITEYPAEVSPLARRSDTDPFVTDRFELMIAGREIANGFSELNDSEDQAERFLAQAAAKSAGDIEAMHYDEDYITALEYGLPPTAGEGIGIDRLVMLLTDSASIRDVLLFPLLRPKAD